MKNKLTLGIIIILFSSCGVKLQSVVQSGLTNVYENPLLVILYGENQTWFFSNDLKNTLEETFSLNHQKVEILLIETSKNKLVLNATDDIEMQINNVIKRDNKDLVIIFKPVRLGYSNGGLQSASYQLIGVDVGTKREVWKADFSSSGSFGPSTFAKASAQKIYQKLKEDRIFN